MPDLVKLIRLAVWATIAAAVYQELRKPPALRTWHGTVAGVVPYDFRVPTVERLKRAYWDPDSEVVFSERVFGVGWAVNIPVFTRKLIATLEQYANASRAAAERLRPPHDASA